MNAAKLIKAAKRVAGYPNHRFEVSLVHDKLNPNYPFRPNDQEKEFPWDGDLALLSGYTKHIKPGTYLECWVYNSEELEDNVYIWIDSETTARVKVCGVPGIREVQV